MALRGEGGSSHACVIVRTSVHTIHTSVFSFTMFTATNVLSNSINDRPKLEMSRNIIILEIKKNDQGTLFA